MKKLLRCALAANLAVASLWPAEAKSARLTRGEYEDRVKAVWTAQIIAVLMGFQFEHKVASTEWVDRYPKEYKVAPVDDDYYYEMVALRGFEKYGIGMTVEQLGRQWLENSAGSWGSSEQTRLLLGSGVKAPETGHPRYNKLWFTIGPQFSSDIYGSLAPGMPNVAGKLARNYGHVNGYAEGVDGAVFMAGMVSLGFSETDPKAIVRKAAQLIHPDSPYRQCLDQVISMAEKGNTPQAIFKTIEDRWGIEYPATNNAVANGGIVAASVWFGESDFLKTVNLAYHAADFTDADCNAANAATVVAAIRGMKGLPMHLVEALHDRIVGSEMGGVKLTPVVDESISDLARRTVAIGEKILAEHGAKTGPTISIPAQAIVTQPAELFKLADLMQYWNPDWKLDRAGFGGAGGGLKGLRGNTYLDGDVLATYPRDEVRGLMLTRSMKLGAGAALDVEVGADEGRAWMLDVYAGNERLLTKTIEGSAERSWQTVHADLGPFAGRTVELRLYQRVLTPNRVPGNAYWRNLKVH